MKKKYKNKKKKIHRRKNKNSRTNNRGDPFNNKSPDNSCSCSECICKHKKKCCFKDSNLTIVRVIYAIATLFWLFLIYYLEITKYVVIDYITFILLGLPLFIFLLNSYFIEDIKYGYEKFLLKGNVLYVSFIAIGIFINWDDFTIKTPLLFYKIIYISLIMLSLSVLDFWYEDYMICIYIRTVFQTLAICLLLLALYIYYGQIIKEHYDIFE